MRGRVIAVLLSSIFITATASSQCEYRWQYSAAYRASIFDVSIDGNDLWAATGYGVQLFDRSSDPPRLVASVGVPGLTRIVRAANGIAYAGGNSGIAVVRKNGRSLQLVRTIALPSVNDLVLRPTALFAATASGVAGFDLVDALNPTRTAATFATSAPITTSIAATGSTLYVADGDSSVEIFSIAVPSSPQKQGTLTTISRATIVNVVANRLYISDGQRTDVWNVGGSASIGTLPYATNSIADAGSNIVFIAGSDRTLRAVDATIPENFVELFDADVVPSGGTVNRVTSLQIAAGRLYAGGGDTGLTTYDLSRFGAPFPLRGYAVGSASSVVIVPTAVYIGRGTTGIQELNRSASGLVPARMWSPDTEIVQDSADGLLLTSTNATLKFWTLTSTIPTRVSSATFAAAIRTAFLTNSSRATVLLEDGTLWTADMSATTPAPVRVATGAGTISQLARSGSSFAATEVSAEGNTTIHYWQSDLNAAPVDVTVAGISNALALNGQNAAVFTFRGITIANMPTATQMLLAGSNSSVVNAIRLTSSKVIALTEQSHIRIWNMATSALEKDMFVPGSALALDAADDSTVAAVATAKGVATIDYGSASAQPSFLAQTGGNAYYKKAVASPTRLYLFDGRVINILELASTSAPNSIGSFFVPGAIDIAASNNMLFTLSSSGVISELSPDGVLVRSATLNEGIDVTPLAISAVAGAPWVSFSIGCKTGNCEKRTSVFDPQSLVRTASFAGAVVDVAASGSRAYTIVDLPSELRVLNVADPLHPSPVVTRATDVSSLSISSNSGTVYVLGDKVYAYSESSLTRVADELNAQTPSATADLLIDNGCATITGRSAVAETYGLPQWNTAGGLPVPGSIRSVVIAGNRLIILTDYSVEIWSRSAPPKPARRRS